MKKMLLILSCFIAFAAHAQNHELLGIMPMQDSLVVYDTVVQMPGLKKDDIYARVKHWTEKSYTHYNYTITSEDNSVGRISMVASDRFTIINKNDTMERNLAFNLDIYIKDGKYKLHIYSILNTDADPDKNDYIPAENVSLPYIATAMNKQVLKMQRSIIKSIYIKPTSEF